MKRYSKGFTLIELMIVVAILGILGAVAYPSYVSYVTKANRADAIDALLARASRMEDYYIVNDSYEGATIAGIGGSASAEGLYTLTFSVAPTVYGYTLVATPVGTDAECTTLTLNSLGEKGATGSNPTNCW